MARRKEFRSYIMNDQDHLKPLLDSLRESAVERDHAGGHAAREKALLREHGLLNLSIPREFGGDELPWPEIYRIVRRVAGVDSALGHVLAFHHLQIATVLIYGNPAQKRRWLSDTVRHGYWWGNAMNPLDTRLVAREGADGFRLNGVKGFCSGTTGSSFMTLSALHQDSGKVMLGVVPTVQDGIRILDDWDPIGQRQTDSNSVEFTDVPLPEDSILRAHYAEQTAFHTLRTCFAQLVLVNLYVGIASGALDEARRYALSQARPWVHAGAASVADDPLVVQRFAEMHVQVAAATALADRAGDLLEKAYVRGPELDAQTRGEVAVAIAEAKVLAHRAGLYASQELFEVVGARGAKAALGFDRFWRNVRTHTLHDPLDYKLQVLGKWALLGETPSPTLYN
jgi:alkylation response protein AidB-like acyl-CoA dehydrogenase